MRSSSTTREESAIATIEQQLIDKHGKREFGRLMDAILRIVHDCKRPDCVRCNLASHYDAL